MARLTAVALLAASLVACGSVDRTGRQFWQPYRPNVQQGNWITQQQIAQLRAGMTREQVRFVLGSPTLTPLFHGNRWEYPYYMKPGYGQLEERKFTVFFENDRVTHWEGDPQPRVQPFQDPTDETAEPLAPLLAEPHPDATATSADDLAQDRLSTPDGAEAQSAEQQAEAPPQQQPRLSIGGGSAVDQSTLPRGTFGTRTGTEPLR